MGVLRSDSAVRGFWAAVVTGVVAIFVTALTIFIGQSQGGIPSPAPPVTTTAPPTIVEVPVTMTATATITPQPGGTDAGATTTTFLDAIEPTERTLLKSEAATLGGVEYIHSLTNPMASCSEAGPVTWVFPQSAQRLVGEVGVENGAAEPKARIAFLVQSGSSEVFSQVLAVGEHQTLDVPVKGGERVTIETRFIPEGGFRGNCNTEAVAVWGDLRVQQAN